MSALVDQLREARARTWEQAKSLADRAAVENRQFDGEENRQWTELNGALDEYDARIKTILDGESRAAETERQFDQLHGKSRAERRATGAGGTDGAPEEDLAARFRESARTRSTAPIEVRAARYGTTNLAETRALTTATDGGSLIPTDLYGRIIERLFDESGVMAAGPTMITSADGNPLSIPRSTSLSAGVWVPEGGTIASSDPSLSALTLTPHKVGLLCSATNEMLTDESFGLIDFLGRQAGTALAMAIGPCVVSGASGNPYPTGALYGLTPSVTGVSGLVGSPSADELINLCYSLKDGYARSASCAWILNRATLRNIRKLKDANNRYLFGPDLTPAGRSAGLLLGRPVYTDPWFIPAATGAVSVAFGDWSRYLVRTVGSMSWVSDQSLGPGFANDTTWFRAVMRVDGGLIDPDAIVSFRGNAA